MALTDYRIEWSDIKHKNAVLFKVRGLGLDDLSILVKRYLPDLNKLAELFDQARDEILTTLQQDGILLKLLQDMPELASYIIVLATEEDAAESFIAARSLPLSIQVKAIVEVLRLTFEDVGGPKEFAALIKSLMDTMN